MYKCFNFFVTKGNVVDNNTSIIKKITKNLYGKLVGNKGYLINKDLFEYLYLKGVKIITKVPRNMLNYLLPLEDKLLLRKSGAVESAIRIFKDMLQIEHSRHRSLINFMAYLCSFFAAYVSYPNKPAIALAQPSHLFH